MPRRQTSGAHTGFGFFIETRVRGIREANVFLTQVGKELKDGTLDRLIEASRIAVNAARNETHSARVKSAMTYDARVRSHNDFISRIGPSRKKAFFAHFLEFGTSHSRPFPFLAPAVERIVDEITELVGVPPSLGRRRL
jgi:HK97 gp10 family phage protein